VPAKQKARLGTPKTGGEAENETHWQVRLGEDEVQAPKNEGRSRATLLEGLRVASE